MFARPLAVSVLFASALPALLSLSASGQTACLRGRIAKASGEFIAQAHVTLAAAEVGADRTVLSDAEGGYQICELQAGDYRLTAAAPGFSSEEQLLSLTPGSAQLQDLTLRDTKPAAGTSDNLYEFRYSRTAQKDLPETPSAARARTLPHGEVRAMWGSGLAGQPGLTLPERFPLAQFEASIGGDLIAGRTSYFVQAESTGMNSQMLLNALGTAQARAANSLLSLPQILVAGTSIDARLDHRFSTRDAFYTRFTHDDIATSLVVPAHDNEPLRLGDRRHVTQTTVTAANTRDLSANMVNENRAAFISTETVLPPGAEQPGVMTGLPTARRDRVFEAASNIYRQVGGQSLKFGGDFLFSQMNLTFLETAAQSTMSQSGRDTGLYVVSERRVRPDLLLTSGVRYEVAPLSGFKSDRNSLTPQVGIAWSPASRTILRGGGAIYYDRAVLPAIAASDEAGSVTNLQGSASLTGPLPASTLFMSFSPNMQRTYVETANAEVEQQVTTHSSIVASYQYARGLQLAAPIVHSTTLCASVAACRAGQTFRAVEAGTGAESSYDGFTVAFVQEPVPWGNYKLAYTYASADSSGILGNGTGLTDVLRRVTFNGVLHTSAEPASDVWQHFTRGFVLSMGGDYSNRSEFTGINFLNVDTRLTKTLAWGQHYHLEALAESFNSFERTSAPFLKSFAGMGDRFVNVYSTYRAVASLQGPTGAQFGLRLGF